MQAHIRLHDKGHNRLIYYYVVALSLERWKFQRKNIKFNA